MEIISMHEIVSLYSNSANRHYRIPTHEDINLIIQQTLTNSLRHCRAFCTDLSSGGSRAFWRKGSTSPSFRILICSTSSSSGVLNISGS